MIDSKLEGLNLILLGSSGVGKGFVMENLPQAMIDLPSRIIEPDQFKITYKVTDRDPRKSDAQDGVLAVDWSVFDSYKSRFSGIHTPFPNGKRYGWLTHDVPEAIKGGQIRMADYNVAVLEDILSQPGFERSLVVGLVSSPCYRQENLLIQHRGNGWPRQPLPRDPASNIDMRVAAGNVYQETIQVAFGRGAVDFIIEMGFNNRESLVPTVRELISRRLNSY